MLSLIIFCRQITRVCNCSMFAYFGMWWHLTCAIVCLFLCLLFCFLVLYVYLRDCLIFCVLVVGVLLGFFGSFRACFFSFTNQLATSICACSFSCSLAPLFVFLHPPYLCPCISYRTPLPSPHFLHMILSGHHDHPYTFPGFFRCVHASRNTSASSISWSFWLVFSPLRAHASIHTHRNRSIPIYTQSHHFLTHSPKHDVWGNFPGHRTQILACETLNDPFFPCFCASRAPCAPTHPCAPINTHLHYLLLIHTLFLQCIYVNLIEKQYSKYILTQIFNLGIS